MTSIMTLCSLLANSLVRIFIEVFKREIGMKSETVDGLSILGKSVIWEPFKL
jgi:hypothetical protein